jgi:SAM-dependent methyltransferase
VPPTPIVDWGFYLEKAVDQVREFYRKVWREYADRAAHPVVARALQTQNAILKERLTRGNFKRVLDLGCGPSPAVRPGWTHLVVYADIIPEMLADLKQKLRSPTVCLDAANLPFRTGGFDLVWCSLLVDHISDLRPWIDELLRILEPEGTLALACWDQTLLPAELYPEGQMCYPTSSGEVLRTSIHHNWKEAQELLREHDPRVLVESYPIVKDRYVLQIAWANRRP